MTEIPWIWQCTVCGKEKLPSNKEYQNGSLYDFNRNSPICESNNIHPRSPQYPLGLLMTATSATITPTTKCPKKDCGSKDVAEFHGGPWSDAWHCKACGKVWQSSTPGQAPLDPFEAPLVSVDPDEIPWLGPETNEEWEDFYQQTRQVVEDQDLWPAQKEPACYCPTPQAHDTSCDWKKWKDRQ